MTDKLKMVLKVFADFSTEELDEIAGCFKSKSIAKNQVLLLEGNICREFYFIQSGCIRSFFLDKSGREKTRYVMLDNHIGTALASFISQEPSGEFTEAVDDTEVLYIGYFDFYRLNKEMNNGKKFYQRILEMAYNNTGSSGCKPAETALRKGTGGCHHQYSRQCQ